MPYYLEKKLLIDNPVIKIWAIATCNVCADQLQEMRTDANSDERLQTYIVKCAYVQMYEHLSEELIHVCSDQNNIKLKQQNCNKKGLNY